MLTPVVQRWREGRASYRPAGELIDASKFTVEPMTGDGSDKTARAFVEKHHYSHAYPAARRRFGLYEGSELAGVAVFSQPTNNATLACLGPAAEESAELGRFVLLDRVKANGETWFLARCFEHLKREGFAGVVSFSDPMPRMTTSGEVVHKGHIGTIYQASSAVYLGRARGDKIRLLPDGNVLHNRGLAKLRKMDKGWHYVAAHLEELGAAPRGDQDPRVWVEAELPKLVRYVKHPGNLKYVFPFDKRTRKAVGPSLPYEKFSPQRAVQEAA